jgi:predicted nucleic acid-binding Zn ribbon protein
MTVMQPQDEEERNLHDDYRRRQVRVRPVKPMRDVLSQLLAKRGYAQVQTAATCQAAWREAVGEKLAAATRPGNVRRGVLEVLVRNSATLQELAFVKVKAVRTLNQLVPEQKIRDVRFRVGPID